jgi:hypothetical protein
MGKKKDWMALIELLRSKRMSLPYERSYRIVTRNWQPFEAARILAGHADETVPLLKRELERTDDDKMICYTLGLCGSDEAVATLKERTVRETDISGLRALIYSLSLAGDRAEAAVNELAESAEGDLKFFIEQYKQGQLKGRNEDIRFPDIPAGIELPIDLQEGTRKDETLGFGR